MPNKEEQEYKKDSASRRRRIEQEQKKLFEASRPTLRIEIPVKDTNPISPDPSGEFIIFIDWKDTGVSRGRGLKLSKRFKNSLFAQIQKAVSEIVDAELDSRISRELRYRGVRKSKTWYCGSKIEGK